MRTYESHFRLPRTPAYKLDAEQPVTTLLKHDAHVLDPLRLDTLHASFEQLAEKFRTFRPLLVDIKREYDLVIAALLNLTQEKAFLRSKIQNLICEVGSEQQLDQLRSALIQLTFRNSMVAEENEELKQNAESEEVNFLLNLARLCAPPPLKGPEDKQRSIIRLKERWDRVERWINNRANEEPLLKDLGARLAADPERYQSIVDKDALTEILSADQAGESKQAATKAEIQALHEQIAAQQKQLNEIQTKYKIASDELRKLDHKNESLEVLTDLARSRLAAAAAKDTENEQGLDSIGYVA